MIAICNKVWSDALQKQEFGIIADWFYCRFAIYGGAALLGAAIAAGLTTDKDIGFSSAMMFRTLGLGLLFAGACMVCGWNLGLLFGIPRSLSKNTAPAPGAQQQSPTPATSPPTSEATSKTNTNLEDISDWLTKTIVGVGLTSLTSAPAYIWGISGKINAAGFGWDSHGQLLALSIMLYFVPGGFWMGYVGTRTILSKLFDQVDRSIQNGDVKTALKEGNLLLTGGGTFAKPADSEVGKIDRALLDTPLQKISTTEEIAAWGAAQARAGNLTAAKTGLAQAVQSDPQNSTYPVLLATVQLMDGQPADARKTIDQLPKNTNTRLLDLVVSLYEPEPDGFTTALKIGQEIEKDIPAGRRDDFNVWMACAYSQRYAYLVKTEADDSLRNTARSDALDRIALAAKDSPTAKAWLRSLWTAGPDDVDNDLTCFPPEDQDMANILGPYKT